MSRTEQRQVALGWVGLTLVWVLFIVAWLSVVSFDIHDPPSAVAWPANRPVANWCGQVGAFTAYWLVYYLGVGVYPLLTLLTAGLIARCAGAALTDGWLRFIGVGLLVASAATAASVYFPELLGAHAGYWPAYGPGGAVGTAASAYLVAKLQLGGTTVLLVSATIVGLILAADEFVLWLLQINRGVAARTSPVLARVPGALRMLGSSVSARFSTLPGRLAAAGGGALPGREAPSDPRSDRDSRVRRKPSQSELEFDDEEADADESDVEDYDDEEWEYEDDDDEDIENDEADEAEFVVKNIAAEEIPGAQPGGGAVLPLMENYELPPIELLETAPEIDRDKIEDSVRDKARILETTLQEFKLEVRVVSIETGPVITVFELKLAPGIKVSQIASLSNDMARALKAPAVRVVAPLPGKNTIGIEVPNIDKEKVRIRDLLERYDGDKLAIPLYLGKDASGAPLVSDMAQMPHLLIAGTTGSGKSVCVASIIMSILLTRAPSQVQLILVDPKVVELAMFKNMPHLMCPIVTEVGKAEGILEWASQKMDERYALLAEAGVKDIRSYNKLGEDGLRERLGVPDGEELRNVPVHLPYLVIIIDELADLMMQSAKEVEFFLCRIAQKSRAVGIHLIVSTQRPQANVVTGLIKSNLPCRIAFRVASRLDSRIVLDQNGGELLMGQGDMLFLPPGTHKLIRAQGTFIADDELRAVVKHARDQGEPTFHPELVRLPGSGGGKSGGGDNPLDEVDDLFDDAVEIVLQAGRGSVSLLQRKLTIGYGRASRIIDQMAEAGVVGEYAGSQAREVVITPEDWKALKAERDADNAGEY